MTNDKLRVHQLWKTGASDFISYLSTEYLKLLRFNVLQRALNPPGTTLSAFFTLCQEDAFARTLLYSEVPSYYTWNETKKVFIRRRRGEPVDSQPGIYRENTIGRLYTVHPNQDECFYLCMLLVNVPGPRFFHELKIVDGVTHATFRSACQALNLLEKLWERYRSHVAEDILHRVRLENGNMAMEFTEGIYNETLINVEDKCLTIANKILIQLGMPAPT
ncbi:uncharacterized protein TNCV_848951 [Trichonephila clavipes]|uniref:Uncharacterized protein n=1 Tax=Trichonephila clavipes TaxID=2585209 RepID=A0A8X6RJH2_TRICX|nr:uncharacterized protein TNCV_848951 [Trichonephila clavipes]